MDRYRLEYPERVSPDEDPEDLKLVAQAGNDHERVVYEEFKAAAVAIAAIATTEVGEARAETLAAIAARTPIIYQAALADDRFAGFSDFLMLDENGSYEVWDTKLARAPKPYYAIQLCCYSEMLAVTCRKPLPRRFGIILGSQERVQFRVEDFIHYYRRVRRNFLALQDSFDGILAHGPEPEPGADHGQWRSHAQRYFLECDHLVGVAGITTGQIKKLQASGITTMSALAAGVARSIPKLSTDTLGKLSSQARLQCQTSTDRVKQPGAPARYEVVSGGAANPVGLEALPPPSPNDVFFDMEGYPLTSGGLEYLFGACAKNLKTDEMEFVDWWAHTRDEEKIAFEGFVDWAFARWCADPRAHIYHYASYEVSAIRRLSTRHDTRQEEVDELLRRGVFVDLYQILRQGIRIGESDYSLKTVERFYRPAREGEVATAAESIVKYARWTTLKESRDWRQSPTLAAIRAYNEDDCRSTAELVDWLRRVAAEHGVAYSNAESATAPAYQPKEMSPEAVRRQQIAQDLRARRDETSQRLAELVDFHRREEKPMWWRMFDRAAAAAEELRDDPGCIEGVTAIGAPLVDKQSLIQRYSFDPEQECKLAVRDKARVMFTSALEARFTLMALDTQSGHLQIKIGKKTLNEKFGGRFPAQGSVIPDEYVSAESIQAALTDVAQDHLSGTMSASAAALLARASPAASMQEAAETAIDAAVRICHAMAGGCLVIQGPPGTGKTYTGAHVIKALVEAGKTVGVASNSHKAVVNLMAACGEAMRADGKVLEGVKVGGDADGAMLLENPGVRYVEATKDARGVYGGGVIGGVAWLFSRPEWKDSLDFLFIDEAGQVSLANSIAMARCARNVVLLGDQMQLEQPVQGTHPGDSGLSGLQYALKDLVSSKVDEPVFHAVVPSDCGLFLSESRRMHPAICRFISEAIYEGRLGSHVDCARQRIDLTKRPNSLVTKECGIIFSGVEHDGNVQQSNEEVERVLALFHDLLGASFIDSSGQKKSLALDDFLFVAPYNAQVRALQTALPQGARVGSVDRFQGQQSPVCILSLCSSYGEYGSRGLGFVLDRNRVNVALSRAQCLAIIVADPRIASGSANSLHEMSLLNLFCKVVESGS